MCKAPYIPVAEAFLAPLDNVGGSGSYLRYKAFLLGGDDANAYFTPHYNTYGLIHMAVRWGLYRSWRQGSVYNFETKRFILDLWKGKIVWQNFDPTKTDTYKYKGIGNNYKN